MKETTRATYARAYTRPYQKTGTGKLKLTGNLYGTGGSVHRPFNYRSPPVFLNGRVRCTDRTGELFFDAYCMHTKYDFNIFNSLVHYFLRSVRALFILNCVITKLLYVLLKYVPISMCVCKAQCTNAGYVFSILNARSHYPSDIIHCYIL